MKYSCDSSFLAFCELYSRDYVQRVYMEITNLYGKPEASCTVSAWIYFNTSHKQRWKTCYHIFLFSSLPFFCGGIGKSHSFWRRETVSPFEREYINSPLFLGNTVF